MYIKKSSIDTFFEKKEKIVYVILSKRRASKNLGRYILDPSATLRMMDVVRSG